MGHRSQSRVVSLFISYVTSSNLEYYGIVKSDINTGCYYRMWPRLKSVSLWWLVEIKKKTTKVSKPSKMRPSSSVASAPAQKEHRAASKNGTSAHTHTHARVREARSSRQATVDFVEKSANRCREAQDFEGLQGQGGNATHGPVATTPHNTQQAKPGINVCPQQPTATG